MINKTKLSLKPHRKKISRLVGSKFSYSPRVFPRNCMVSIVLFCLNFKAKFCIVSLCKSLYVLIQLQIKKISKSTHDNYRYTYPNSILNISRIANVFDIN